MPSQSDTCAACASLVGRPLGARGRRPTISKSARRKALAFRQLVESIRVIWHTNLEAGSRPIPAPGVSTRTDFAKTNTSHLDLEAYAQEQVRLERTRIARDLHDDVGQALTGLKLDIAWLKRRFTLSGMADPAVMQRVDEMSLYVDDCLERVRDLSAALRKPHIDVRNLHVEIESAVRDMASRRGLNVFVDVCVLPDLDPPRALHLLRVAQEALANIVRHAQATSVWISLACNDDQIELRIRDDGRGVGADPCRRSSGSGIRSIRERAEFLSGQLTIGPAAGRGTLVHLKFPIS